ncbi:MAG: hypothetical protein ACREVI_10415 [Steroidobacteraceae bacterium]
MTAFRRITAILALALDLAIPSAAADGESDEAALRQLKEILWPKAYAEQDELEYIRGNVPAYDLRVFKVKRLDVFENGSAVVAGEGTVKGADKDGRYISTYQSINVLIRRNGRWQAVSSHISGVKRAPDP